MVESITRIKPTTTTNARTLRTGMTLAEQRLWHAIRGRQLQGHRFRRQHPIGPYIADFACVEKLLLIELDGGQHQDQIEYDLERTTYLNLQGWHVMRFWNNEIFENFDGVLSSIDDTLNVAPAVQSFSK
ncbi:endonuclease domain-containing protein [Herbaspirillum sp. GCM10030257]|uniref:endonuclease domain-containing protein n=1 Tax=Herbaspirillum sp. GCM10030257 TaxID=3273393 RepID=UPI003609743D